jgi:hypothetical protein
MASAPSSGDELRALLLRGIPDKRGILKKRGGFCLGLDALKSVKERWCELRGPVLVYFQRSADVATGPPKGSYMIDEDSVATPIIDSRFDTPFVFQLKTRVLHEGEVFAASSQSELSEWVAAIQSVVQTLQRFPASPTLLSADS